MMFSFSLLVKRTLQRLPRGTFEEGQVQKAVVAMAGELFFVFFLYAAAIFICHFSRLKF